MNKYTMDLLGINKTAMRAIIIVEENFEKSLISFYDSRYFIEKGGQFITQYYLGTLLESNINSGLDLLGHVKDWKISAETKSIIINWILSIKHSIEKA